MKKTIELKRLKEEEEDEEDEEEEEEKDAPSPARASSSDPLVSRSARVTDSEDLTNRPGPLSILFFFSLSLSLTQAE